MRNMMRVAAVFIGTLCTLAHAEMTATMTVIGKNQGVIPGSCTMNAHPGDITIYGYEHTATTLPDPETCMATGRPNHFPFVIIKGVDKATVPLFAAFNNNEVLEEVTLRFYRSTLIGDTEQYYTVILLGAHIAGIRHEMLNTAIGTQGNVAQQERISFTYERIIEQWMPDGMEEAAEWRAQCGKSDAYSDLNLDGVVNLLDFSIMADQWLMQN